MSIGTCIIKWMNFRLKIQSKARKMANFLRYFARIFFVGNVILASVSTGKLAQAHIFECMKRRE